MIKKILLSASAIVFCVKTAYGSNVLSWSGYTTATRVGGHCTSLNITLNPNENLKTQTEKLIDAHNLKNHFDGSLITNFQLLDPRSQENIWFSLTGDMKKYTYRNDMLWHLMGNSDQKYNDLSQCMKKEKNKENKIVINVDLLSQGLNTCTYEIPVPQIKKENDITETVVEKEENRMIVDPDYYKGNKQNDILKDILKEHTIKTVKKKEEVSLFKRLYRYFFNDSGE